MRTASVVVLAVLVALAAGSAIPQRERKVADNDLLVKQKNMMKLFFRVHQNNFDPEQVEIAKNYDLEAQINNYKDIQVVKRFLALYKQGALLRRGEVFSVLYKKHMEQAHLMFDVLFQAKDYDTFYRTACWGRDRVNEGQFVYVLSMAILNRPDTQDLILPPVYEILPEYFTDSHVTQEAYKARLQRRQNPIVIRTNYTHVTNPEQLLAYFTEDIGLNSYNTYLSYEYPLWINSQKYGINISRRGELFYYSRQQLLARYHLERECLGLPGVETFDLNIHRPVKVGYAPHLRYRNGEEMPSRPEGLYVRSNDLVSIDVLELLENRLKDAIDSGTLIEKTEKGPKRIFLQDVDAMNVIGNLVHGNADSVNKPYFKSLYLTLVSLFGHIIDPLHKYDVAPSALEHFETLLRDPMYYRIVKRVVNLFQEYKNLNPGYTREEVVVPGVKIESVDIDKLITYFDDYEYDLNGMMDIANKEEALDVDIRVIRQRLNHKPYTVRVNVNSEKAVKVVVRFFLGPKYDYLGRELTLEQKRLYLVEMDRFPYMLEAGSNEIVRNSRDSSVTVDDQLITRTLLKKVDDALEGKEQLYVGSEYRHCGFPQRLLLPRGNRFGKAFSVYVVVSLYDGKEMKIPKAYVSCGGNFDDTKPFGYPFDRVIDRVDFLTPNIYHKDVTVFHKTQEEINKAT